MGRLNLSTNAFVQIRSQDRVMERQESVSSTLSLGLSTPVKRGNKVSDTKTKMLGRMSVTTRYLFHQGFVCV